MNKILSLCFVLLVSILMTPAYAVSAASYVNYDGDYEVVELRDEHLLAEDLLNEFTSMNRTRSGELPEQYVLIVEFLTELALAGEHVRITEFVILTCEDN